jgi:hypothetical protein
VAVAAAVFVAATPLTAAFLTWDYVSFLVVPYMIGAISLWLLGDTRRRPTLFFASGFLACCAIASHAFVAMGLGIFYLTQAALALWRGRDEVIHCAISAAIAAFGFVLCATLGWIAYRYLIGNMTFFDQISIVLKESAWVIDQGEIWSMPLAEIVKKQYNVYLPTLLLASAIAAGAWRSSNKTVIGIILFCVAYTAADYTSGPRMALMQRRQPGSRGRARRAPSR